MWKTLVLILLFFHLSYSISTYSTQSCETFNQKTSQSCRFENICYIQGQWTVYSALPSPPISLKLGTYDSSQEITIKTITQSFPSDIPVVETRSILFFAVSEMYFHWLLDDMFGLFWLMNHFGFVDQESQVILTNPKFSTHTPMISEFFTPKYPVLSLSDLSSSPVCFRHLIMGGHGHHLGGPGSKFVTSSDIEHFKAHMLNRGKVKYIKRERPHTTLVLRKHSRVILNPSELQTALFKVISSDHDFSVVYLEDLSKHEQLHLLAKTDILIAMHGSAMANILFLPPSSAVIEIMPYGFNRPTFKGLSSRFGVTYFMWQNQDKDSTIFHPDTYIRNLSPSKRASVVNAPAFDAGTMDWAANLYWVNQDTRIDTDSFIRLFAAVYNNHNQTYKSEL